LGYWAGVIVICCLESTGYLGGGLAACFDGGRWILVGLLDGEPLKGVAGAGRGLGFCIAVEEDEAMCTQSFCYSK